MGKSTLAQKLLKEKGIPYVSTDGLTVMLKPAGQPSFYSPEKAELFYPYLDLFISRMQNVGPDYVIEGDAFSPHHVDTLKQKYDISCVFLIMSQVKASNILQYIQHDAWARNITDEHMNDLINRVTKASEQIATDCNKYELPCFDLSHDYTTAFERAYRSLITAP
jgi:hypothetical protein